MTSGTVARAWKVDTGWIEGQIAKVFPDAGGECFVFFSDTLGGFVGFGRLDSLMIRLIPDSKTPDDGRSRLWQVLVPRVLWQEQLTRFPACSEL
jgi:hypothetical protein